MKNFYTSVVRKFSICSKELSELSVPQAISSIYLSLHLFIYLSICLPINLICLPNSKMISLSIYVYTYLPIYLPTYLPTYLPIYLSYHLFSSFCRVSRMSVRSVKIRDWTLAPYFCVAVPIYHMHHMEEIYPDPEKFIPER